MVFDKIGKVFGKGAKALGGGRLEVIKWPDHLDPSEYVAWRYPKEDIRLGSVLIVDESQRALFFRDGKLMGIIGPGRHVLDTQNVPFLHGLVTELYGETIFKADVVFVNLLQYEARFGDRAFIDWIGVHLLFNGTYYFTVDENRLETFYVRLLGRRSELSIEDVRKTVNPMIISTLVDALAEYATQQAQAGRTVQNVSDFLAMITEFGEYAKARLAEKIDQMYGIRLAEITLRIDISEEDKRILQMSGPRAYAAMYERDWRGRETISKNLAQSPATGTVAPFVMFPWMMYPPYPPQTPQPPQTPPVRPPPPGYPPQQYPPPPGYPPQYPYPPQQPQQYPAQQPRQAPPPQQYPYPYPPPPPGYPPQQAPGYQYPQQPQQPSQIPPGGAQTQPLQQPQQAPVYKCPYCGRPIPFLSPVCPHCAARIKWCPDGRPVREDEQC